jgi:hypothetical protein
MGSGKEGTGDTSGRPHRLRKGEIMGRAAIIACVALFGSVYPAFADAIDGQWCLGTSHFEINGPSIRTPAGNSITGNYHRHGFEYVVPGNEQGAGTQIVMVLLNEETVQLTRGTMGPETWKRCKPVS